MLSGTVKQETQWGIMRGHSVEVIIPAEANEGYMSPEQYARKRAEVSPGRVVKRTKTVTVSDWEDA